MELNPNAVSSREQLAQFIEAFRQDLLTNPEQWENATLETFLAALSRYIDDVPGYLRNVGSSLNPETASWQLFATVLCGARIYE